ncbi:hypothetical protein PR001_g19523 [Phytophthora rubi]|uniref:Ubiquitin-like protease family profile domain-containing protein n=1 Tax=Phytophthora rubi TaxID=129364 RepID=A0A6A3JRY2_9STRA|nr:hypothetical protein PR001_g19523 [Phytophthora rubi]
MAYRKTCGNPLIIPFSSISPRWFGQSRLSQDELTEVEQPFVAKVFKKKPRAVAGVLSDAEKYRRAQQAFGRISGELAQLPDEVFESAMSDLDKWWYNLRHGKTDLLPPPSSGNDGSGSGGGGGNDGGAPGGSASQGEGPQDDHHDGNAKEGNMQDDYGSYDEAPTQAADSTTQAADCEDLYCFRDSAWLNDDAIKAFAVVLANYKNNVTITATPQGHGEATQKKRSRKGLLSSKTLEDVVAGASTHAFVLLPVNFGGTHWGCLVVDQDTKQVKTYDSKNGKRNKQRLKKIASEIIAADSTTASYTTVEVAEPLQSDSDSCGVFVCRFFWTCVSDDAPSDVTPTGITKLRCAMLEAILKMNRR